MQSYFIQGDVMVDFVNCRCVIREHAMIDKLPKAQARMLLAMYKSEHDRTSRNMTRVVRERLLDGGYISCQYTLRGTPTMFEITAKGLRAIDANELDIVTREELEHQRRVLHEREVFSKMQVAAQREAEHKAKIIARVRAEIEVLNFDNENHLWSIITRIVEIHEAE